MNVILNSRFYGCRTANFTMEGRERDEFLALVREHAKLEAAARVYFLKTAFTNQILRHDETVQVAPNFFVGQKPADGIVVPRRSIVCYTNADCPAVCLYEEHYLAVLHGGFRCLIRENVREVNLVASFFRRMPRDLPWHGYVGYGIGPCCYGAEHWEEIPHVSSDRRNLEGSTRHPPLKKSVATATRGPRAGQRSLDLLRLAEELLAAEGIPRKKIAIDGRCTSCARDETGFLYWSHIRAQAEGSTDGRNLAVFWLE